MRTQKRFNLGVNQSVWKGMIPPLPTKISLVCPSLGGYWHGFVDLGEVSYHRLPLQHINRSIGVLVCISGGSHSRTFAEPNN